MAATPSIIVGGAAAAFERCRPLFEALGMPLPGIALVQQLFSALTAENDGAQALIRVYDRLAKKPQ